MPSGRTHDSITLWTLPLVAGVTYERTRSAGLTLILSGGYLFSGLMFGPDLDIHSQQYKRWGILRWIWLPYRRSMKHRSFLSHGPMVGTVVRLVYLLSWLIASLGLIILLSAIAFQVVGKSDDWRQFMQPYATMLQEGLEYSLRHYVAEWLTLLIGLELGALSHVSSDWIGSRLKRWLKQKPQKSSQARKSKASRPSETGIELPTVPPPVRKDSQFPPF